jgi:hypothetical protein
MAEDLRGALALLVLGATLALDCEVATSRMGRLNTDHIDEQKASGQKRRLVQWHFWFTYPERHFCVTSFSVLLCLDTDR